MSIVPLRLDAKHAIELGDALRLGAVAAKGTRTRHSLVLPLDGKRLGFNGWHSYVNVVGAAHNAKAQAKHTTLLYCGEAGMLQRLRAGLPGFDALESMALDACPGMQVAFVHVLQQSSAQACFNWHTDTQTEGYDAVCKTMVVLLSDTASSMQVQGEPEFAYSGVGAAALFDSDRIHRSGQASAGTLKIALMLKPMDVPPSVANTIACAGAGAVGGVLGGGLGKRTSDERGTDATSVIKRRAGVALHAEYLPRAPALSPALRGCELLCALAHERNDGISYSTRHAGHELSRRQHSWRGMRPCWFQEGELYHLRALPARLRPPQ